MKVSDLTGAILDYWVARAEGYDPPERLEINEHGQCCIEWNEGYGTDCPFHPSDYWPHAGPIIERERISIWRYDGTVDDPIDMWFAAMGGIHGWDDGSIAGVGKECCGETALIAAMRAYVASKFGDEGEDLK